VTRAGSTRHAWSDQWRTTIWAVVVVPPVAVCAAAALAAKGHVEVTDVGICAVMFVATLLGIEAGYHRQFAHRSFSAGPIVRSCLAGLGSMAFQGSVLWWAGVHRTHHRHADREGDPHSPLHGLLHAHVGWLFRNLDPPDWRRRARDLFRDGVARWATRLYFTFVIVGFALPALMGASVRGSWQGFVSGLLWGGLVRMFLVNHVIWSINSICHAYGSRPYATRDRSANNPWLALPSLGFSWHNNHHAFPRSAVNSHERWQLDLSGLFIQLLGMLGLAWSVRKSPAATLRLRRARPVDATNPVVARAEGA